MFIVYILLSELKKKTYTGVTSDLTRRLIEHNQGKVSFSNKYRPFKVIHTEEFHEIKEAYLREKFYKSTTGRRRIKEIINKLNMLH